ncbi:MAG TPA: M23 family metallopeptidase [Gemmatimonadales bacterium]|nr:M23 family metallopeptidase [Gemmatimonadales bacterium]
MRGLRVGIAAALFGAAAAAALSGRWPWRRVEERPPARFSAIPAAAAKPVRFPFVTRDTLHRGETLSHLLARHGVTDLDPGALGPDLEPRRLRAGLVFSFHGVAPDSAPARIRVRSSPERWVTLQRGGDGWTVRSVPVAWQTEVLRVEGGIDNSLYEALDREVSDSELAGPERVRLAWDLADVFAWEVDFTRDIQPGDHFTVVFERLRSPEGEVRFGRILASELSVGGRGLTAFRFEAPDRKGGPRFYAADGRSLRRAFLRAPLEFRRISSGFSSARYHPILGRFRRHEGTDYAAAPGTPVMAAGDGVVLRAGVAGGYGNLIELRHRSGITTRYGHLRRFARGVRPGARVAQGQVIGFVGSTGLATGPHLHYEFRVNGAPRDSRRVNLGDGDPIPGAERAAFEAQRDRLLALLHPSPVPPPAIAGVAADRAARGARD